MVQQVNFHPSARIVPRSVNRILPSQLALTGLAAMCIASYYQATRWDAESASMQRTQSVQRAELQLREAQLQALKTAALTGTAVPTEALRAQQLALSQREQLLEQLRVGLYSTGERYSDRLQWVARSIPAMAWVDYLALNAERFELRGFTREPADLSQWVKRLTESPGMDSGGFETVEVSDAATGDTSAQPGVWTFRLVSALTPRLAPTSGSKP